MAIRRARSGEFYDTNPNAEFSPGDIWSDLPSFGVLPDPLIRGIVVTPVCDFANEKTEAVTYLPFIPLPIFFLRHAGPPDRSKTLQWTDEDCGS